MLLFIREAFKDQTTVLLFQYISCYSLSPRNCDVTGTQSSFNTSHVTLYPGIPGRLHSCIPFQYISCYSLSFPVFCPAPGDFVSIHLMLLFIGKYPVKTVSNKTRFNTSHVTLYPKKSRATRNAAICFNTSHVTLYPKRST